MISVLIDKLRAAEPDRWPGYAAWVIEQARDRGGAIDTERVWLPGDLHARVRAEASRRSGLTPTPVTTMPAASASTLEPWPKLGPKLWAELHAKTGANAAWLEAFRQRIPCGECRGHWSAWVTANPPDYGDGWHAWTVAAHNAVNVRLGKPVFVLPTPH